MNKLSNLVVDRVENGIIVIGRDHRILLWNKWLESYSSIMSEDVIGHPLEEVIPLFKKTYYQQIFHNAFTKGQSMFCSGAIHSSFVKKIGCEADDDSVRQNMRVEPIAHEGSTIILLQINDISSQYKQVLMLKKEIAERKKVERAIRHSEEQMKLLKDEALQASKAKSEFLAVMSHEIRTPMNAIIGMAELLQETALSEEQREYVSIFQKSGNNLMRIINDILDISKIESGKTEFVRSTIVLPQLLDEIVKTYSFQAKKKGLDFIYEPFQKEVSVYGDPTRLHQVISNLLSNGVKFTEEGFVHFKASYEELPTKQIKLVCEIKDTGIGIPEDKRNIVFDYFTQLDSSTTRKFGGTGLGLAIVKSLVEKMNGTIQIDGNKNGSKFTVSVILDDASSQQEAKTSYGVNNAKKSVHLKGKTILVAEDSPENIKLIAAYLKNENVTLHTVENGREALEAFERNKYDLILMDIEMPEIDGLEATKQIRHFEKKHHRKHTPILALTAHALDDWKVQTLSAGCNDHLVKPIKKQVLLDRIYNILSY